MIKIIRSHIRMIQYGLTMIRCYKFRIRIELGSNLLHKFWSDSISSYFHLKFILGSIMQLEREWESRKTLEREGERENPLSFYFSFFSFLFFPFPFPFFPFFFFFFSLLSLFSWPNRGGTRGGAWWLVLRWGAIARSEVR